MSAGLLQDEIKVVVPAAPSVVKDMDSLKIPIVIVENISR
jgi:hypothetical protein